MLIIIMFLFIFILYILLYTKYQFLRNIYFPVLFVLFFLYFYFFSLKPYLENQYDYAIISFEEKNILLYENEINRYTEATKKQIEEYNKLQNEMVKFANQLQLQYWSKQQDEISRELSNRIKDFNDLILKSRIEINKREAFIERRKQNKYYFWLGL